MKSYGANKATEFNKGNLSPIYKAAKNGELKVEKWFMNRLYELAEYYGYDDNGSVAAEEKDVFKILEAEDKQEVISEVTEKWFSQYSTKAQKSFNRSFVQ